MKAEVLENEASVSEHQEKLYDIRNSINIKEQGIEHLKGKIKDIASQKQKNTAELEMLRTRAKNLADEVETIAIMADESGVEIEKVRDNVLQNQASLEELKAAAKSLTAELEEKKIEFFELATEKAKAKNTLVGIGKGIEDIRKRKERDVREADENRERLAETHRNLDSLIAALNTDEGTLANLTDSAGMTSDELERAKNDLQLIDERISEMKDEAGMKSSRLASLIELQESYAWCSDGTKSIMQAKKVASPDMLPGETCLGLVADVLDVPREYETAVESVLGDKLQYMVVRSQRDGMLAIDYLKSSSSGRGTFVPLEVRHHNYGSSAEYLKDAVKLIDVVNVHQGFEKIADYLLGDVLLIPNLNNGVSLWERNGFRGTFVTSEGDIINPQGVLTGGSKTNGDKSLLKTKREIAELEGDVDRLNISLAEDIEKKKDAISLILQWEEELVQLRSEIRDLELLVNGKQKDLERFEAEIEVSNRE